MPSRSNLKKFWLYEKDLFLKFFIPKIRKFPYENVTFLLGKLYQKFILF